MHMYERASLNSASNLELIMARSSSNSESHVDAAQDVVRVGLAVEESLGFIVTLKRGKTLLFFGKMCI